MFSQGYQYRSLNAFRSALSSLHDKVDGCDVRQNFLVIGLLAEKGLLSEASPTMLYPHVERGCSDKLYEVQGPPLH